MVAYDVYDISRQAERLVVGQRDVCVSGMYEAAASVRLMA